MKDERGIQLAQAKQLLSTPKVVGLWVLGLVLMVAMIGNPPVTRTQEARVLETSRQMLGTGWQDWLLPQLNGEPRLRKPPLSYWMTAGSYLVLGVNEAAGRLPVAVLGWVMLGVVYVIAKRAFSPSPLVGEGWGEGEKPQSSVGRQTPDKVEGENARSVEGRTSGRSEALTPHPSPLPQGERGPEGIALITCACLLGSYLFFRHFDLAETDAPATLFVTIAIGALWRSAYDNRARWFHLAAGAIAMTILAKGAPAAFVLVFFVAFCAVEKRWDLMLRFVRVGAPITFLIIAVPWFAYVGVKQGLGVFFFELKNTSEGGNHWGSPLVYVPGLFLAGAPWSLLLPFALYDGFRQWKQNVTVRVVLLWFLAILVPLCINGNKQNHYLLTLTPPMMMLIGWWIARSSEKLRKPIIALLIIMPILMPLIVDVIVPQTVKNNPRITASQIQQLGAKSYIFYGQNVSLTLCFYLRSTIPSTDDVGELLKMCSPGTIVIAQTKNDTAPPPLAAPFVHRLQVTSEGQVFDCYGYEPAP